jgi:hypothetical protein
MEGILIALSASEFVAGQRRQTVLFLSGLVPTFEFPSLVHGPPLNVLGHHRREMEQGPSTTRQQRIDGNSRPIPGRYHFNDLTRLRTWEQIESKLCEVSLQYAEIDQVKRLTLVSAMRDQE